MSAQAHLSKNTTTNAAGMETDVVKYGHFHGQCNKTVGIHFTEQTSNTQFKVDGI